jgi:hypothetical protein
LLVAAAKGAAAHPERMLPESPRWLAADVRHHIAIQLLTSI